MKINIAKVTADAKMILRPVGYMIMGATVLTVVGFTAWMTINADVMWKAVRYPEAVRQMEVEILVKK